MSRKPSSSADIPWWTVGFFGVATLLYVAYLVFSSSAADKRLGWIGIVLFGGMFLLSLGWNVGRRWQSEGARWNEVVLAGDKEQVFLLRASRLQSLLLVAIMLLVGGSAGAMVVFSPHQNLGLHSRWEAAMAAGAGLIVALFFAWTRLRAPRGIALVPEGLWWLQEQAPLFVPWEAIADASATRIVQDVGHGFTTRVPALGVRLQRNPPLLEARKTLVPPGRVWKSRIQNNHFRHGLDLVCVAESLVLSLEEVAFLIVFFRDNPRHRRELRPGESSLGFLETLLRQANEGSLGG